MTVDDERRPPAQRAEPRGDLARGDAWPATVEDRLRVDEQRFRLICLASNDALWDWDLRTGALWWSDGFQALFGHDSRDVEPGIESWTSRIHADEKESVVASIYRAISEPENTWFAEYRFRRRDGGYALVRDRGYILRDSSARAVRMVGGMRDISELRRAEDTLREQAALLDAANDAIIVRDMDGTVTYWNPAAARVYGKDAAQAVGRPFRDAVEWACDAIDEADRTVRATSEWAGDLTHLVDGREITVASRWSLVRGVAGKPRAILSIGSDVTRQRVLEAQALGAQRMESIGTLASGIAHDLNNVLTPILLSTEVLQGEAIAGDARREMMAAIATSARRGAAIVRQLVSFARGAEGERLVVHVPEIVAEVQRIACDAIPSNILVSTTVARDLPPVLGDATQLHQLLLNLLLNARDAMPAGGRITLDVRPAAGNASTLACGKRSVVVRVSDTGPGIPREVRERVFEPFFTTKGPGKGTGLGLSIALAIVKGHGGTIDVSSEEGSGTTFVVQLPAASEEEVIATAGAARDAPRGEGQLVLIVDDEEPIRLIARQTLTAFGYRVITASNGAEAAALFERDPRAIDVVLTDMTMPVMDGPATIRALRGIDPDVRIVATSGFTTAATGGAPRVEGADLFLPKPFAVDELLRALHDVLAAPRGGAAVAAPPRGA